MEKFASISDRDLECNLKSLVRKERALLHLVLEHINEFDVRKVYSERGFSSMYDYLTKELRYSGSAAVRRLEAARMMRVVPQLGDKIQDGTINLSQVGEFSRAIKEKAKQTGGESISSEDKIAVVEAIAGLDVGQTQKVVSMALDIDLKEPEKTRVQKDDSVHLSITLSREQFEMLKSCRDQAAHQLQTVNGDHSWAHVIEILAGQYLDGKSFASKVYKRQRDSLVESSTGNILLEETLPTVNAVGKTNKTLTLKTRRFILNRDKCCQYKDKLTGKICGNTYGLQVDHINPQWAGGDHSSKNLQALCWSHNQAKYRSEARIRLRR
ncbi:HNH endonuclease [Bdellovibrio sp. HCB209]|uniref:HNH endonuclease n=1 Tax=Bdellovibrio sp. HCB209 TaxID=3394354 RepID=UPI0039B507AB